MHYYEIYRNPVAGSYIGTRRQIRWPALLSEGGWARITPDGHFPPAYHRQVGECLVNQVVCASHTLSPGGPWFLYLNNRLVSSGTLSQVLEEAHRL